MAGQTYSKDVRVPMSFTSLKRRRLARGLPVVGVTTADAGLYAANKSGLLMTNVDMLVNPSSVEWTQNKRMTKVDVRDGSRFFHFLNSAGQNNDFLTLKFSGSTGNIDIRGAERVRRGGIGVGLNNNYAASTGANQKWLVWHNLYQLSREEVRLGVGAENWFRIDYSSNLFTSSTAGLFSGPVQQFYGFFDSVLEFTESADKPNSRDYSFSFTVTSAEPDLDEAISVFTSVGFRHDAPGSSFGSVTETIF
tara:strand:- start:3521 stop:4270 length:750 start_codon:yes stop_codon:yes gene_type:complete